MKTTQIQTQKQILSPVMQQSIEVLMLPLGELDVAIENELQENPVLEVDEEKTVRENKLTEDLINQNLKRFLDAPINRSSISHSYESNLDDDSPDENPLTCLPTLEDHLFKQLKLELTDLEELKIGELIIGNLNEDGYLTLKCEDIAQILGWESVEPVEYVLKIIQNFDPIGIGARNLKECLLVQVSDKFNGQSVLIKKIINRHLKDIAAKRFNIISKAFNISISEVKKIIHKISFLEPKPARKYRQGASNIYIKSDVTVVKDEEGNYKIQINKDNIPYLRVSSTYQKMLRQTNCQKETKEFIREKVKNALFFIKSVEQRHQTLSGIAQYILDHQKDFFDQGHMALKPMILKEVALAVDRNESTISRAIHNKYMDTPQGLLAMKFFFSQAISHKKNGVISNRSIKEEIKNLVDDENKSKPLSDQAIQKYFENQGVNIARRTISKYRQALKILPSHLRKIQSIS